MKFGFTYFSSYPNICAISAECAARQDRFWEMYNILSDLKTLPDTLEAYKIAESLNLDMKVYDKDFHDKSLIGSISNNFENLKKMGFYASPTYTINGRVIFNSSSLVEMEEALDKYINNNN